MSRIVIGLDYGTTFTGVAYADSAGSIKDIQLITDWPGNHSRSAINEKVPSQVAYGDFPPTGYAWGNLIAPGIPRQFWTKLDLDKTNSRSMDLADLLRILTRDARNVGWEDSDEEGGPPPYPGKEAKDIVTDYLTGVKQHVFTHLRKVFGKELFESCSLDVVVTVPAVWSDKAKDLTFQAVTAAGFVGDQERIKMVTEPEAAATYTLKTLIAGAGKDTIKTGDYFVLCDAGGGTVDLLSYKVSSTSPNFRVEEAAVGSGDKCGATFVNRNFMKWISEKLGENTMAKIKPEKFKEGGKIAREFEAVKMAFDGTPCKFYITIPHEAKVDDDPERGIEDGELLVTDDDLKAMFDPCVNRTLELIDEQAAAVYEKGSRVKHVLVVGGFGKSEYLFNRISEYCKDRGFEARRPPFPWSAVARGAVARGLESDGGGLVELRKCRYHYGTPVSRDFDPSKHEEKDAYIDELTGEKNARGQMNWLLAKGDSLPVAQVKRVSVSVARKFKLTEERICSAQLAYCTGDNAPTRYMDEDVLPLCTVKADLRAVPVSKFMRAKARAGGQEFYIASFSIELVVDNSQLKWRIMFDGEECGLAVPSFDASS